MDLFVELFGSMLAFVYHCFDRIGVGSGYMRKVVTRVQNDENPLYNSALAPSPADL